MGYSGTTVGAVAKEAGVAVDTVYTAVGRKPDLARAVIDAVLGGEDARQRDYVQAIRAQRSAEDKLAAYAAATAHLVPRIAPLQEALRRAGDTDATCAVAWKGLVDRRAKNMREFAADLRATGQLRPDLADAEVADLIWSMNAAEYWLLLEQRGWSPERYQRLLRDVWTRTLLITPTT
ncbi:MAG: TetR/AcrR family transcriptional regulator [Candidatus Nanopelagicales bacterium]